MVLLIYLEIKISQIDCPPCIALLCIQLILRIKFSWMLHNHEIHIPKTAYCSFCNYIYMPLSTYSLLVKYIFHIYNYILSYLLCYIATYIRTYSLCICTGVAVAIYLASQAMNFYHAYLVLLQLHTQSAVWPFFGAV